MREKQILPIPWKRCLTVSAAGLIFFLCAGALVGCYKKSSEPGCSSNEDCDDFEVCRDGECRFRCTTTSNCDDNRGCTLDVCELPLGECSHYPQPAGTVCRLAAGDCDLEEETCDGTSPDCPEDTMAPETVECRPAAGPCDLPEYCTGVSPQCPDDGLTPLGEACDDGDACTYDDRCDGFGGCVGTNGLHDVAQLSTGPWGMFTCALLGSGELRCWGNNNYGQLGDATSEHRNIPTPVLGLPDGDEIVQIESGGRHANVLLASGRIMAWGLGDRGQLGNGLAGADYQEHSPVEVIGVPYGWRYVSGGYNFNCAIQEDNAAFCWGSNDTGQLGTGTLDNASEPAPVAWLSGVAAVTSGIYHACAIDTAGALWCWGRNDMGQLGNPTADSPSMVPVQVDGLTGRVIDVACGVLHTCALLEGGEVWCWGTNEYGQLGSGEGPDSDVPVHVSPLPMPVQDLDSGYEHTCAILESGELICWGHNDEGQIGESGAGEIVYHPVFIENLVPPSVVVVVATGAFHTCALLKNTTVMCWGHNAFGELGIGSSDSTTVPTQVRCDG